MYFLETLLCALLLCNGSFEQGLTGWRVFGEARIVSGVCGTQAIRLNGALQTEGISVARNQTYVVTFKYRGKHLRATGLLDLPATKTWRTARYEITPQTNALSIGFEGLGKIDCVQVTTK